MAALRVVKSMKNQRLKYVDFYKFLGITLMIMGHVGFGSGFDKYIHAFHMPMFFVASGYCFSSGRCFGSFALKRSRSILIPYFVFSIITFLALRRINDIRFSSLQHIVWLNNVGTPIAGVWFLTALLWSNLIYFAINRIPSDNIRWFTSIVCFLLGATIESTIGTTLPWSIAQALVGVFFIHIGKCQREKEQLKNVPTWIVISGIVIVTGLVFLNNHVNVRLSKYDNIALFLINAVAMSVLLLVLSTRVEKKVENLRVYDVLCSIGHNSICYLVLNQIVIRHSSAILENDIFHAWGGVKPVIVFLISYVTMYLLSAIITNTRLRTLVGDFTGIKICGKRNEDRV